MKNKFMKRTLSLVLVLMLVLSTAVISIGSVSAASNDVVSYCISAYEAPGNGVSHGELLVNINGTEGSTGWYNLGTASFVYDEEFTAPFVGEITSIDTFISSNFDDGWYPEFIDITSVNGTTRIYGGEWVDNGEVVNFGVDETVYEVTIYTADVKNAGTDLGVHVTLFDEDGDRSKTVNASNLSHNFNAFERGDITKIYISVPDDFDNLKEIRFELYEGSAIASGWKLEGVCVRQMSGTDTEYIDSVKTVNQWGDKYEPIRVYF